MLDVFVTIRCVFASCSDLCFGERRVMMSGPCLIEHSVTTSHNEREDTHIWGAVSKQDTLGLRIT
jgi:hypothetical protein